jgi:hypothetical protein
MNDAVHHAKVDHLLSGSSSSTVAGLKTQLEAIEAEFSDEVKRFLIEKAPGLRPILISHEISRMYLRDLSEQHHKSTYELEMMIIEFAGGDQ